MERRQYRQRRRQSLIVFSIAGLLLTSYCSSLSAQNPPPAPPVPAHGPINEQVLQLNPTQSAKFKPFENACRDKKHELLDKLHDLRKQIWTLYQSYNLDVKQVKDLNRQLNSVQQDLLNLHLEEQIELRKILTPAQFGRLQSALRDRAAGQPNNHWQSGDHGNPEWSH